ncbi:MAG TPA: hypothetical protein VIF14_13690 [Alphaproteobacteria bacterium]|jgi:hypothetical protein
MTNALLVDRKQRILVARLGSVLTEAALTAMRAAVRRFVAKEGPCPAILDLSAVDRAEVSSRFIADLAESGPTIPGETRVLVAPKPEIFGLSRMYELQQNRTAGPTLVVHTLAEAYEALGVRDLDLEPVEGEPG